MTISISEIRNAKIISADGDIDLEINHPDFGWIPYTLSLKDRDTTVNNKELLELIGDSAEPYVPPTQQEIDDAAAATVRKQRDEALAFVFDPVVLNPVRWAEMSDAKKQAWQDFRTKLLDIPLQDGFPHDVEWPDRP